jgi:hypothetical protein
MRARCMASYEVSGVGEDVTVDQWQTDFRYNRKLARCSDSPTALASARSDK